LLNVKLVVVVHHVTGRLLKVKHNESYKMLFLPLRIPGVLLAANLQALTT
jgi:hypothetical protein